ncbi:MAG TPA: hypothetical protein VFQ45_13495 [Longimicrobium sp.]|nr:hypothetical protein [Longimicrobium sp.]
MPGPVRDPGRRGARPGPWTPHLKVAAFAAAAGVALLALAVYEGSGIGTVGILLLLLAVWPYREHRRVRREQALPPGAPRPEKPWFRRDISEVQSAIFIGLVGVLTLADDGPELLAGDRGEIWSVLGGVGMLVTGAVLFWLHRAARGWDRNRPDDTPLGPS